MGSFFIRIYPPSYSKEFGFRSAYGIPESYGSFPMQGRLDSRDVCIVRVEEASYLRGVVIAVFYIPHKIHECKQR